MIKMCKKLFTSLILIVFVQFVYCNTCSLIQPQQNTRKFPSHFIWGTSTSAYQIEGAWNVDGKGESIWDHWTHANPEKFPGKANADVSADSYHLYKTDVKLLSELNIQSYRFSISWTRVLPNGLINQINPAGIQYYNNLIDELLSYNITPMVTIYHWDLPQRLQELGGWTNVEIVPIYTDFSKLLFETYGDRVKNWITMNEAFHVCQEAYDEDTKAPGLQFPGIPSYMCAHNLIKAHAEAYHLYNDQFRKTQNGRIGITLDTRWIYPKTNSSEDQEASERALQFYLGWFAHPIFSKEGDYPQVMRTLIDEKSRNQGFPRSRLPKFTLEEINRIRGTSDFFGINTYTAALATKNRNTVQFAIPSYDDDMDLVFNEDPTWIVYGEAWLKAYSKGMYQLLKWVHNEYNHPEIVITESGMGFDGGLNDQPRIDYINAYLSNVLDAIEDGVNVTAYFVWTFIDNYEWNHAFETKFGLYQVDFQDPYRKRTPKASARAYAQICKTGTIN